MPRIRIHRKLKKKLKKELSPSAYYQILAILRKKSAELFGQDIESKLCADLGRSIAEDIEKEIMEALVNLGSVNGIIKNPYFNGGEIKRSKNIVDLDILEKELVDDAITPDCFKDKSKE